MKAIKYIGQILAAIIYSPLYTGLMYIIVVFPLAWILKFSFWKALVAFIIFGGVVEGLMNLLQTIGIMPYYYIIKKNNVAYYISLILCVLFPLLNIIHLWYNIWGGSTKDFLFVIIVSGFLIQFVLGAVFGIVHLHYKIEEDEIK